MMERGELMAEDVLPKVGASFAKFARQGGALAAQLKSGRKEQARFMVGLKEAGDIIYKSGFEEGISGLFATMTQELLNNRHALKGLGQIYRWFFDTIGLGIKIISPVVDSIIYVFGEFAEIINRVNDYLGNKFLTTSLLAGGALFGLNKALKTVVKTGLRGLPIIGALFSPIVLTIGGVILLLDELFSLFEKGRVGLLEKFLFGEDLDLNLADIWSDLKSGTSDLIDYLSNLDFVELTGSLADAIMDGIFAIYDADIVGNIMASMSELGNTLINFFVNLDWAKVGQSLLYFLVKAAGGFSKAMISGILGIVNYAATFIERLIQKIPSMGDFQITDDIESFNKFVQGNIDSQVNSLTPTMNPATNTQTQPVSKAVNHNKMELNFNGNLGTEEDRKEIADMFEQKLHDFWGTQTDQARVSGTN